MLVIWAGTHKYSLQMGTWQEESSYEMLVIWASAHKYTDNIIACAMIN